MTTEFLSEFLSNRNVPLEIRIERQAQELAHEFSGVFNQDTVNRYLRESLAALGNVRLTEYAHILAGRFARERLRALARAQGQLAKDVPAILYLCNHNAGRSQMAAAFTAQLGQDQIIVMSAGSTPSAEVNAVAIQAMAELGIDLTQEYPKPITEEVIRDADVVITMGCGDACPVYPGKRYEDWELADPAGQPIELVRDVRDGIEQRVRRLMAELHVAARV